MSKRPKLKKTSIPGTGKQKLQTPCGVVHSIWEPQAPITMHGYLPYFSEYLLSGELFFKWCRGKDRGQGHALRPVTCPPGDLPTCFRAERQGTGTCPPTCYVSARRSADVLPSGSPGPHNADTSLAYAADAGYAHGNLLAIHRSPGHLSETGDPSMIAIASKPIRKRRQTRARRCTFKNAYTRFFTRVQYGPNLYAGYYAMGLAMDPMGLDYLDCLGQCIEDNDPIPNFLAKMFSLPIFATAVSVPKTWVLSMYRSLGMTREAAILARQIASGRLSSTGAIPQALRTVLTNKGLIARGGTSSKIISKLGPAFQAITIAVGTLYVGVEIHCACWCWGENRYNASEDGANMWDTNWETYSSLLNRMSEAALSVMGANDQDL